MLDLSSGQVRWFALLLTLVLIPVTYLLSASGKVQVNAEALNLFAPLPAVMSSPEQIPGSHRCFCSSVQRVRKYGRQMSLWSVQPRPAAFTPACWVSSAMTTL